MAPIKWDQTGERFYETGTDHGVLYPYDRDTQAYTGGVAWNGLTGVTAAPSGAEASPMYADNMKYANPLSAEEYGGTIEAFTYPVEFEKCDGSYVMNGVSVGQQKREMFGFSWRSRIGNDVDGDDHGYKIHLVWGALAQPSEKGYTTVNDTPEAMTLSWTFTTTPVAFDPDGEYKDLRPTAYATIDSTTTSPQAMVTLENMLYNDGKMPSPDELMGLAKTGSA